MYVFFASVFLMNKLDLLMNQDQVLLGVVIGTLLGWLFSKIMKYAYRLGWTDQKPYVAQYLALAVFLMGLMLVPSEVTTC